MIIKLPFTASYELPRTPVPRHFHLVLHVCDRGLASAKLFEQHTKGIEAITCKFSGILVFS